MSLVINVKKEELVTIKNKINNKGQELINELNKIINDTEATKDSFNSLTADLFREEMINYLNGRIEYINNNYLSYVKDMDKIIENYEEFYNSVAESVGDNNGIY